MAASTKYLPIVGNVVGLNSLYVCAIPVKRLSIANEIFLAALRVAVFLEVDVLEIIL